MKCLPECGYNEKPDNLQRLERHLQECLSDGAFSKLDVKPTVIWKDGEFTVVTKFGKKDQVFEVNPVAREPFEVEERFEEPVAPLPTELKISRGRISSVDGEGKQKAATHVEKNKDLFS